MWIPESCLLISIGLIVGGIIYLVHQEPPAVLTSSVFFIYMLPAIVLESGYFIPTRPFFENIGTVCYFSHLPQVHLIFPKSTISHFFLCAGVVVCSTGNFVEHHWNRPVSVCNMPDRSFWCAGHHPAGEPVVRHHHLGRGPCSRADRV